MTRADGREVGEKAGIAGYVLAGGASRRFGSDKALAKIGGKILLQHMCQLVESVAGNARIVAPAGRYAEYAGGLVEDRWPGEGPLGGITSALSATASESPGIHWNLMVSCDMPFLSREWLEHLKVRALASAAELVVPQSEHGLEPLCACWRTAAVDALQVAFDNGTRKVTEAMKHLSMEILDETHWKRFDSAGRLFWNMNTPLDYQEAVRMWETEPD